MPTITIIPAAARSPARRSPTPITDGRRLSALRFRELAGQCLLVRKSIDDLDKPPKRDTVKPKTRYHADQWEFAYA